MTSSGRNIQTAQRRPPAKQTLNKITDNIDMTKIRHSFKHTGFDINSIIRGAQLTLVGAQRALQNPNLFTSDHYRQAAYAVAAGLVIRLIISVPIWTIKILLATSSLFVNLDRVAWDDTLVRRMTFFQDYVLQVPFFLMTLIKYVSPTLDNMFMESLRWVDQTYVQKHQHEGDAVLRERQRGMYYPMVQQFRITDHSRRARSPTEALVKFATRYGRKVGISLVIYALSYIPLIGRLVLPAASFYTFNKAVGPMPAAAIFGIGIFLPRRYLVMFLQTYFSSRSLMRELLEPYFSRVRLSPKQMRRWFRAREGILFGFGVGFYLFLRIPLLGVLIYGIAEASTAYLITKITEPPPPANDPVAVTEFLEREQEWRNKHEFLNLSIANLDTISQKSSKLIEKVRNERGLRQQRGDST